MKNPDELRTVCIGDLIELGLIRVNPEADTSTGNARYMPTGNNDPVIGRRLEGLYLAAQVAQVVLPSAEEVVAQASNAVAIKMMARESTRDKYWWIAIVLHGLVIFFSSITILFYFQHHQNWSLWTKEVVQLKREVETLKEGPSNPAKSQQQKTALQALQ